MAHSFLNAELRLHGLGRPPVAAALLGTLLQLLRTARQRANRTAYPLPATFATVFVVWVMLKTMTGLAMTGRRVIADSSRVSICHRSFNNPQHTNVSLQQFGRTIDSWMSVILTTL
jgi:hypothetical protein